MAIIVYSYRAPHSNVMRFVVAGGDRPADVISQHGSRDVAVRAARKLAAETERHGGLCEVVIDC